jgi:hypothetical protein
MTTFFDYFVVTDNKPDWDAWLVHLQSLYEDAKIDADEIGIKYKPTGKMIKPSAVPTLRAAWQWLVDVATIFGVESQEKTAENGYTEEMVRVDGWHVNVRSTVELPELAAIAIEPSNPVRVWA